MTEAQQFIVGYVKSFRGCHLTTASGALMNSANLADAVAYTSKEADAVIQSCIEQGLIRLVRERNIRFLFPVT